MIINNLDPVLFSVGPLSIRWYGLMYVCAFLFTYWYCANQIKHNKIKMTMPQLDSLLFWLVISMIAGARLFEVLFWQRAYYFANPMKILAIWEGGLSFHGSLVAMVLVTVYLSRKWKLPLARIADLLIVPLSLGQSFGRIGNFFNHELVGKVSSLPWAVNFNGELNQLGELVFRHPNQLYEATYNVIIFAILLMLHKKGVRPGVLFAAWLVLYAVCRFFTEFLRVGEPMIGPLTTGQCFNLLMIVAAGLWWRFVIRRTVVQ